SIHPRCCSSPHTSRGEDGNHHGCARTHPTFLLSSRPLLFFPELRGCHCSPSSLFEQQLGVASRAHSPGLRDLSTRRVPVRLQWRGVESQVRHSLCRTESRAGAES